MVFSGIYPIITADYEHLKANMGKLQLNDSAFVYQAETSVALGFGFRCGFLARCTWRLCRSGCGANTTWTSSPPIQAWYPISMTDGTVKTIHNRATLPEPNYIQKIEEPMVKRFVICLMMKDRQPHRADLENAANFITPKRWTSEAYGYNDAAKIEFLIYFHDRIKKLTRGYGSMDY